MELVTTSNREKSTVFSTFSSEYLLKWISIASFNENYMSFVGLPILR